ncbi:hypothetical protein Bca4012_094902 [Brassica carinata]
MEDEGRRMKRKARERERERGVELFIISLFRCKQWVKVPLKKTHHPKRSIFIPANYEVMFVQGVQFLFLKCKVLVSKLSG